MGKQIKNCSTREERIAVIIEVFRNTGYDYLTLPYCNIAILKFEKGKKYKAKRRISLNVYEPYTLRTGLRGGIDINFLLLAKLDAIRAKIVNLLKLTVAKLRYALGFGDSISGYIIQ